jgi:F-type H+-transporting ATPase subunit delta
MPLTDSKPDAVAMIYAKSLFELAEKSGGKDQIEGILGELEDILEIARTDKRFGEFLSSRVIPDARRGRSLTRIFEGRASDLTVRFLGVVNEKGRLGHLPAIVAAYDGLVQKHFGRVEVDVFTADPIGADELRSIQSRLASAMGKEVILHPYTDSAMIGGVKFRIGDQLIDGSLATRLRKLRDQLSISGTAAIRSRFDRMIEG